MSRQFDDDSPTHVGSPAEGVDPSKFMQHGWAEGELRQVVELAADAIVIFNDEGQIALVNAQTEQLFGYDRHELLGQSIEILMPDRFRFRCREQLVDYVANPCSHSMGPGLELNGLSKEGKEFPVDVSLSPIETAGGVIVSTAIRDVTERDQAAASANEARILAEAIVETVREPLLILNDQLYVQSANHAFYKMFGAKPQDTENSLVYELGNRQWDIPRLRHLLEQVLPDKSQFNDFEVQHSFERIGERTMLLNARKLDREGERPGLILLAIEDITHRKRAEELVDHLSSVPEENPNPFVETDLAGNVTYLNPAALAQLPDLTPGASKHPFLDGIYPMVAELENSERDSFVREVEVGDATYEQKTHVAENNLIRIFANNITKRMRAGKELKRSADKLHRYNLELERSNRELQDFAYVVSHDLRAPLVNLQGFSHELRLSCERLPSVLVDVQMPEAKRRELSTLLEEDIPEAIEFITTNATKMDGLLSGVLQVSRVGQAALTIRPLDINQMLSEIVASRQFAIEQAGASVQVDSLPNCCGDELQINQVFSNLLDNALKYLESNRLGVIRVCGQEEPNQVVYSIEDNGIGIAAQHQDSIYKVFHRLDPQRGTGDGLGLTIVRSIMDRHGGKIWVESEVNEGSKFYLSLPNDK